MSQPRNPARDAEVDTRYRSLAEQYGDRFDSAAEEKIRNDIGRLVDAGEKLRAWTIANGDEPDFIFNPARKDG